MGGVVAFRHITYVKGLFKWRLDQQRTANDLTGGTNVKMVVIIISTFLEV